MRHILRHLGIIGGSVAVLMAFGLAWHSALAFGLLAGCLLMGLGGGHQPHAHKEDGAQADTEHHH